jgi:hypothetical protein
LRLIHSTLFEIALVLVRLNHLARVHRKRGSQTIWIVDARGYGKRFVVRTDETLTAFLELESAVAAT